MATKVAFYGGPLAKPEGRILSLEKTPPMVKLEGHPGYCYRFNENGVGGPQYTWHRAPGGLPGNETDWTKADWSQSNAKLAELYNVAIVTVAKQRASKAPETVGPRGRPETYDWSSVDWSQSDEEIAKRLGCQEATVKHARIRHKSDHETTERTAEPSGDHAGQSPGGNRRAG